MSSMTSSALRLFTRVDVKLTLFIAGSAAALSSLLLCGLLAFTILESLEEQAFVLKEAAADIAAAISTHGVDDAHARRWGVAYRATDGVGQVLSSAGRWPPIAATGLERASLGNALTCTDEDYLLRRERTASGVTVDVALSLGHFVRERRELVALAAWVVLLGMLGSLGFGAFVARRALRPVRETAEAVRAIDSSRLGVRIATRGTADDIDQLAMAINEVLARLEWAFGRLSRFSTDVAHELRTPLNRMLTSVEVALLDPDEQRATGEALEVVRETAQGMQGTVEQLLLLAKGEEGRLRLTRERVELGALLAGLVNLYLPLAEETERRIEFAQCRVYAGVDRVLVTHALVNLLENALHHTLSPSTIRVSLEQREGQAIMSVEDSAPGVAVDDRERIFERFVRIDPGRQRGGVGLGLSIARMIARLHGGELWVEDSPLGGSAFRFALRVEIAENDPVLAAERTA